MLQWLFPTFYNRVNRKPMEAMTINLVPNSFEIPRLFSLPSVTIVKITTPPKRSIDNWTDNRWYSWDSSRFLAVCDLLKPKKQRCNAKNHSQISPVSYLFDNPEKVLLGRGLILIYLECRQCLSRVRGITTWIVSTSRQIMFRLV